MTVIIDAIKLLNAFFIFLKDWMHK